MKNNLGNSIKILKIDVDKNKRLAAAINVKGVPTLILYKNSKLLWRQSGLVTKNDLILKINEFL